MTKGPLIILSGPSGSGKTTVASRVIETSAFPLRRAISATTRPPRAGEVHGRDYYFLTAEEFEQRLHEDAFLEYAKVHECYYGTLKAEVDPHRERGTGVMLVIDVQGAAEVRRKVDDHVSIFLMAPTLEDLDNRLRQRGLDSDAVIESRLANARREIAEAGNYQYRVVNKEFDQAVREIRNIIESQFRRSNNAG